MKLAIIAAVAENGVIGRGNRLPWHLSEDLKYFKKTTLGKPIIMGRKTFDSIGKALPGRLNIVVTRQADWCATQVKVAHSLAEALELAALTTHHEESMSEAMLIGGAQLYAEALPQAEKLYLTRVHTRVEGGDAFFPELDETQWRQIFCKRCVANDANDHDYTFMVLDHVTESVTKGN